MGWTDNLRAASFRGASFKVESHDASGGRRTVVHEFPLRDTPFVEDMGRKAKEFSVSAYVLGDDYMRQRDALMRACDEAGSGDLVHPYLGTLRVVCTGWALRESNVEGRIARLSLTFVESGEAAFPGETFDAIAQSSMAADVAKAAAISDFSAIFSADGLPDFASVDAIGLLTDGAKRIDGLVRSINGIASGQAGFLSTVNKFTGSLTSLIRAPGSVAASIFGLVEGASTLFDAPFAAVRGLGGLFDFGSDAKPATGSTATRRRQQQNQTAVIQLIRRAAVIEAARLAPAAEYETSSDAIQTRDAIADAIDRDLEDPATTDDAFTALQALRTTVVRSLPPPDVDLPNLATIKPPTTLPALVLAYDLYEDASREGEIVTRNRIRHPGFVPGGQPLQVMSDAG